MEIHECFLETAKNGKRFTELEFERVKNGEFKIGHEISFYCSTNSGPVTTSKYTIVGFGTDYGIETRKNGRIEMAGVCRAYLELSDV